MNKGLAAWLCVGCAVLGGCKQVDAAKRLVAALKAPTGAAKAATAEALPVQPTAHPSANSSLAQTGEPSEATRDHELADKLAKYIDCFNRVSSRSADSKAYYLMRIKNPKSGPTGKEQPLAPYELYADQCFKELDQAQKMKPAMETLDAKAAEYKAALAQLDPLIRVAHRYYDQRDYLDDKLAKGKELHPQLMAAWDHFEKANEALRADVVQLNEAIGARRLTRLAADPNQRLQYLTQSAAAQAKQLIKIADVEQLSQLNNEQFEPALKSYEQAWNELEQYGAQHSDEIESLHTWSLFELGANDFLKAAKELGRRKRDNKDFNHEFFSRSNPKLVAGHPAQVIDKYNSMINGLNTLRF